MQYEENEDGIGRKIRRSWLVGATTDFSTFEWKLGQRFASREDFKQAVAKYGILQGRNMGVVISNKARRQELGIRCVSGCPFYLYSSWHSKKGSFIVRKVVSEHRCQRNMNKNKQLTTAWAAKEMLEVFKSKPHWPAKDIKETIKRAYKVLVSDGFAYKVKYKAHKLLHGSMKDHYLKVGRYIGALNEVSPATILELVVDGSKQTNPPIFQRLFNCFDGLSKGWKEGCRRVICVDAAFLQTFLGGQILSAVGRDGNEQMYPITWAVVEGENTLSWEWFFKHLQTCLELGDGSGLAIISDEHQAILSVVATVLPAAEHRHCARHVYAHWHKNFSGDEMRLAFWRVAKAYNLTDYNEALDELNEQDPAAAASFKAYNPSNFCRASMNPEIKCDAITKNMAETLNGYIIHARTKHLLYMMEDIRRALMQRVATKKKEMEKQTSMLFPRIKVILEKEKEKASMCEVIPSTDNIFNASCNLDSLVVNLSDRSCTCRKRDMMGVPCCHAVACIYFKNLEAEDFVADYYKREVYLRSYANPIPDVAGERHWPRAECSIDPPPIKIGPGRPRKNRIKDPFKNLKKPGTLTRHGMEMTCRLCNKKGHNKRGCPDKGAVPQEPPPKKPRGRPGKYAATPTVEMENNANNHHSVSAQPTQLGRGGRMILGGVGARGGSCGRGSARGDTRGAVRGGSGDGRAATKGRGRGRNQLPRGVGVLIGHDGTPITTVQYGARRTRTADVITNKATQPSQKSCITNNNIQ